MRLIVFFDLPVETSKQRRDYRHFVKDIKKLGFFMMQESVYVKLGIDVYAINSTLEKVKKIVPSEGNIQALSITEKQFSEIKYLLGEKKDEVINTDDRVIKL